MTTGNIVHDNRYTYQRCSDSSTLATAGQLYVRSWSGTDRAHKGDVSPHPYSGYYSINNYGTFFEETFLDGVLYKTCNWPLSVGDFIQIYTFTEEDQLQLLGKLAGKISAHNFNAGIFVGELGKTVDMVAGTAKTLARAAFNVKRGNFLGAAKILGLSKKAAARAVDARKISRSGQVLSIRDVNSDWLALRYGWRPLLNDVYEMSKAITQWDKPHSTLIRAQVKKENIGFPKGPLFDWITVDGEYVATKRIIAIIQNDAPALVDYLGLTDPLSIAWELVPFSFVADWFIPVGNYLRTRSVISGTSAKYVTTVYHRYKIRATGGSYNSPPGFYVTIRKSSPVGSASFYSVNRTISTSMSVPLPSFRNPIGSNPATRALDAIALLRQAFR